MYPGSLPYALPLLVIAALDGGLALYAFRRRNTAGATVLGGLLSALAAQCLTGALEYLAPTLSAKILIVQFQFLSLALTPPLWLAFALHYAHHTHWLTLRNRFLLALPGALITVLAFTNDWHRLVWSEARFDPAVSPALLIDYAIASQLYAIIAYAFFGGGILLYFVTFARAAAPYRKPIGLMAASSLLPLAAHLLDFVGLSPLPGYDLTTFALGLSAVPLAVGLFRYGLFDLTPPIAAQTIVDHLRDAVIVLDARDRIIDLNPAARQSFNLQNEAIGRALFEVLPVLQSLEKRLSKPGQQVEIELGDVESRRWYEVTVTPLKDGRGRALVLHDHTREMSLLRMRDDLTQMILHDLHNPLSAIYVAMDVVGVAEWDKNPALEQHRSVDEREALRIAYQSSLRAQEMIDNLLATARLESGQMPVEIKAVNLAETLAKLIREMTPLAGDRNIDLRLTLAADPLLVRADRALLDRVVLNLIGNALKFIPVGGRVTLAARRESAHTLVSVADTGPGIPPAVLPHVFEKFARGESVERGYGLGLAFCRLAVEAMGGRIWVESPPGQGATFFFTLETSVSSEMADRSSS
jgi:signal transduction histidine kinase